MTTRGAGLALAVAVAVAACGRKVAPPDAAAVALRVIDAVPASTATPGAAPWLTFRLDPGAPALQSGRAMLALVGARCGVDPAAITGVEGFVARPFRLVVDVRGKVTAKGIDCLLAPLATAGQTTEPAPRVTDAQGGVRIELEAQPGSIPWGGAAAPALPEGAIAVAFTIGPWDAAWGITFAAAEKATLVLVAPTEGQATAVLAWLDASIERAADPTLLLGREREGRTVRIVSPSTATLADAVRTHLVEAFRLPAGSMRPTLLPGDQVLVAKGVRAGQAARGDLVVYRSATRPAYVKRVVGIAGDRISIVEGALHVNGTPVAAELTHAGWTDAELDPETGVIGTHGGDVWTETLGDRSWQTLRPTDGALEPFTGEKIPAGHVFVLGDDRNNSLDSRQEGPVPLSSIVGHPVVIHWSSGPRGVRSERLGRFVDDSR